MARKRRAPEDYFLMANEQPQPLPYVRVTALRKRKSNQDCIVKKEGKRSSKKAAEKLLIKRPEEFVKEYRDKEFDLSRMKLRIKLKRSIPSDSIKSNKLLFVIHIHGYPNLKSVEELIYKKGRGRMIRGEQVPLTDITM